MSEMRSQEEIARRLELCRRALQSLDQAEAWKRPGSPLNLRYRQICARVDALEWALGLYGWENHMTPTAIEREIAALEELEVQA